MSQSPSTRPTAKSRSSSRRASRLEDLVLVSTWLFNRNGVVATRMEELALAAEMTLGNLYNYVSSKEELAYLCYIRSCEIRRAQLDIAQSRSQIGSTRIELFFHELLKGGTSRTAILGEVGAHNPPWESAWNQFLAKWISRVKGEAYESDNSESDFRRHMTRHRDWIDISGTLNFDHGVSQSIHDFIQCQNSRDTFAPSNLGAEIKSFDTELRSILEPYAVDEVVSYKVRTCLEWGSIRVRT